MKTFVLLMASSATFGSAIALVYWLVAHEITGTLLLALLAAALLFTAGYAIVAERDASLVGDDPATSRDDASGERLGIFTARSAYPPIVGACAWALAIGVVWSPFIAAVATVGLVLALWRMGAESARTRQ